MTLLRRGMILAGVVLVSVLGGFLLCLLLHQKAQEQRSPAGVDPSPPAPGFVPPTGNRPQASADVPRGTPMIATGHGRVEFGAKLSPEAKPDLITDSVIKTCAGAAGGACSGEVVPSHLPEPTSAVPASHCFLSPEDIGGDCDFEIVGTPDAPMLRMKWTGRVRVRDGQQVRGPITLPDVAFDWRPPVADTPAPRTLLGVHGGVSSAPGYEAGVSIYPAGWAFQTRYAEGRVGGYVTIERDLSDINGYRVAVGASVLFGLGKR